MNREGGMTFGNIVKLIMAVAVVIILLMLVVKLFSPIFNRGDETAKSYFETLKNEIKVADGGEGGEFFMWYLGDSGEDKEFYLVYFGKTIEVDFVKKYKNPSYGMMGPMGVPIYSGSEYLSEKVQFNSFGSKDNRICVCTVENYKSSCRYCEDLEHSVSYVGKEETWYDESGKRIGIELKGDEYVFTEIK